VELGEGGCGEQVAVAEDLVDDVRLGGVEGHRRVPDVLGGVEDPLRERAVELAQWHEPGGGDVPEAGQRLQPLADEVEARQAVGRQVELLLPLEELADRELLVLRRELTADRAPDILLLIAVAHVRHGRARLPRERKRGDLVAALAVRGVVGAGVIAAQVDRDLAALGGYGRIELCLLEHVLECSTRERRMQVCTARASRMCTSGSRIG